MENRTSRVVVILTFCALAFWLPLFVRAAASGRFGRLIHEKDSLYHCIFVYRHGPVVTLRFGKRPAVQIQSQVDLRNLRQHLLEYSMLSFCGLLYKPEPERILVLGLGGAE